MAMEMPYRRWEQDQATQPSSTEWEVVHEPQPGGALNSQWLLEEGETVFLKGMAPVR